MNPLRFLGQMTLRLPADTRLHSLHQSLFPLRRKGQQKSSAHIVVQCVQDPFYLTLFAHIVNALCQRAMYEVELFVPRSLEAAVGTGWKAWILRAFPINRLQTNQWIRLYEVVTTRVAYRSTSLRHPLGDMIDAWRSWRTWRQLRSAAELESISINGVLCGDLVIDTFLRFRPSPRVQMSDPFMLRVLWQAHRDLRRAQLYFRSKRPRLYLTSYTTYIQHGIATRVALQEGVRVVSFGSFQEFGKLHTDGDFFHTRNPTQYLREFDQLPDPLPLLEEARRQLEARLNGAIDTATSYMASSAYRETTNVVPDVSGAVVIFLHDFYDSPHVYGDLVFPDFWEWICFTINTLRQADMRFLVKPHPNQIALSDSVMDELIAYFPELELIAPEITNRQLVDAGMACAVTVYGTVAHEMAYMGVPTIACARHPHIAFGFCRTASDRSSYANLLRDALAPVSNVNSLREQALCFYVAHNLSLPPARGQLQTSLIDAWKAFNDPMWEVDLVTAKFKAIVALPGFEDFIESILK